MSTLKKIYRRYFQNFLEFFDVERIRSAVIGKEMLNFFESKKLPVEDLIGQSYDEVPNMQSEKKGVASVVLEKTPQTAVTNCSSSNLNLALAKAAKIQFIDNTLEQFKAILAFFSTSPKSYHLLVYIVKLRCNALSKNRIVLLEMC